MPLIWHKCLSAKGLQSCPDPPQILVDLRCGRMSTFKQFGLSKINLTHQIQANLHIVDKTPQSDRATPEASLPVCGPANAAPTIGE